MTGFRVGLDVGGTFTDIVFLGPDGAIHTKKISSSFEDYGQDAHRVAPGTSIRIQLSPRRARLAFVGSRPYYEILRTKLNWGGIPKDR